MSIIENVQTLIQADIQLTNSFPANFLWGAATASYQIEGAAYEDGRGLSIWDQFAATPGKVHQGDTGEVAADHYHRMPEDVALMASLGLGAYRFSIAWPRVIPEGRGAVNTAGLDFYDRLVDVLLQKGITPFGTLYHWDLPIGLHQVGGWVNRDTAYAFADYAEVVAKRLGDRVAGWSTLNEPWCSAYLGYGVGMHAPGLTDRQSAYDAAHHLLLAHGLAVPRLRTYTSPSTKIGITLNFAPIYPADERPETAQAVLQSDLFGNRWFMDPLYQATYPEGLFAAMGVNPPPILDGDMAIISTPIDFLGVNNYTRVVIRGKSESSQTDAGEAVAPIPGACYTEMGWEVYPQGLTDLLIRLHRDYNIPSLYVTENGAAFNDQWNGDDTVSDPRRLSYLRDYIRACAQAIAQGVPLDGYFVWSLMDNFEWAEGYNKRFGIIYVDYPTQRRIVKESGHWYAALIDAYKQAQNS